MSFENKSGFLHPKIDLESLLSKLGAYTANGIPPHLYNQTHYYARSKAPSKKQKIKRFLKWLLKIPRLTQKEKQ